MGVHGLWRLLDAFGEVTQPADWKGKKVAIDASIWMMQFRCQVGAGEDVEHRVLEGFFTRILKLLFYGIEPVFVFDGVSSASKASEHRRRTLHRVAVEQALVRRRARQIMHAQVSAGVLDINALPARQQQDFITASQADRRAQPLRTPKVASSSASVLDDKSPVTETRSIATASAPRSSTIKTNVNVKQRRRRARFAPDAVSASTTSNFLEDVGELLVMQHQNEERVKQNALRYTSTSLFMGPRQAVDEAQLPDEHRPEKPPHNEEEITILDDASAEHSEASPASIVDVVDVEHVDDDDGVEEDEDGCVVLSPAERERFRKAAMARRSFCPPHTLRAMRGGEVAAYLASRASADHDSLELGDPNATSHHKSSPVIDVDSADISESGVSSVEEDENGNTSVCSSSGERGAEKKSADMQAEEDASEGEDDTMATEESESYDDEENDEGTSLWNPSTQFLAHVAAANNNKDYTPPPPTHPAHDDEFTPVKEYARAPEGRGERHMHHIASLSASASETHRGSRAAADVVASATRFAGEEEPPPPRKGDVPAGAPGSSRPIPFELFDIVELLDCCGIPFILSPSEADSQCAFLAREGLVDAVFTEDSDVMVHGATTVLRGFFSRSRAVVAYRQADIHACGIDKRVLVALALLLGCDYTEGVPGMGLVSALDAIVTAWTAGEMDGCQQNKKFASTTAEQVVRSLLIRWRGLVRHPPQTWAEADDELSVMQYWMLQQNKTHWSALVIPHDFPAADVVSAFYSPLIDEDRTKFAHTRPNWQRIHFFAASRGLLASAWVVQRYELAKNEYVKREESERALQTEGNQTKLTSFGVKHQVRERFAFKKQPAKHAAALALLRAVQRSPTRSPSPTREHAFNKAS